MNETDGETFKARVSVHFNAVTERFAPLDTIFPITSAKELRDTKLSAACSLHTASGSVSSSTSSLRQRRLMEIAEDEEEEIRIKRQSTVPEERPSTAKASVPGTEDTPPLPLSNSSGLPNATTFQSMMVEPDSSPEKENGDLRSHSPTRTIEDSPRKSTQSARPDMYSYGSHSLNGRPKVKLGPRPSFDISGRPHTSATAGFRPVSTLPPGLKLQSKTSKRGRDRPKSQYPTNTPTMTLSPPTMPDLDPSTPQNQQTRPHTSHASGARPNTSSGSSVRTHMSSGFPTPKMPGVTPEKARLLKMLEIRKRQMTSKAKESSLLPPNETPENPVVVPSHGEDIDSSIVIDEIAQGDDSSITLDDALSGIKTDESDATRSDSGPVSPVGHSEPTESTRASSISESTDETIQDVKPSNPVTRDEVTPDESTLQLDDDEHESPNDVPTEVTQQRSSHDYPQLLPKTYDPTYSPVEAVKVESTVETSQRLEEHAGEPENTASSHAKPTVFTTEEMPVKIPTREWNIPRSKFSIQDLKASNSVPKVPTEPLPTAATQPQEPISAQKSPVESTFSVDTKRSVTDNGSVKSSLRQPKRRGRVEPIRTNLDPNRSRANSHANSEANFSSDDDFMDELQDAVFEEAKPISVSRSPISPIFPGHTIRSGNGDASYFSRTVSNPLRKDASDMLEVPGSGHSDSSRSVSASAAFLNRVNSQSSSRPMAAKVNLGSGISQRIKALEKLSSLAPDANAGAAPAQSPSTAFFSVRKPSVRGPAKSSSIAERANSLNRNTPSPSGSVRDSPENLKFRERSGSFQNRMDTFKTGSVPVSAPRSGPESISVTARILREPAQSSLFKNETGNNFSDFNSLDLKQSPLVIDHQVTEPPKETIKERRESKERRMSSSSKTHDRRSSITVLKDLINDQRTSFSDRRRSIGIERSSSSPRIQSPSRPPSTHTTANRNSRVSVPARDLANNLSPPLTPLSPGSDEKGDKKSNRASRMLRRMSSSLSAGRKTISHAMSPTVQEEFEPMHGASQSISSHLSMTPTTISISDVNVQFPDNLLWKRRSMMLDSQGYLVMAPALAAANSKEKASSGATRRYHLSEFITPTVPDADMQELAHSVLLSFIEGGSLQVACEDRDCQQRILSSKYISLLSCYT